MGVGRMSYTEATTCADNLNRYSANIEKYLTDLRTEINSINVTYNIDNMNDY